MGRYLLPEGVLIYKASAAAAGSPLPAEPAIIDAYPGPFRAVADRPVGRAPS